MTHLMELELKKIKPNQYCFISIGLILFSIIFITISLIDSAADPTQSKDTFHNIFLVIGILLSFLYIIFYGVLVSSIIIKEYNSKTILILFSYPIRKKKVIIAKLLLISIFIATSMFIGYLCCCGYIVAVDYSFDLLEGSFESAYILNWFFKSLATITMCVCLGGLTFSLGMLKKSVAVTIISSIVFIFIRQVVLSLSLGYTENLLQTFIIVIISFFCVGYTIQHQLDCIE